MDIIFGLLILAALAGVGYAWYWVQAQIGAAANRVIFRGSHKRGQAEAHTASDFTAPTAPEDLLNEVIRSVNAMESAPVLVRGVYLQERYARQVSFAFGNKLEDAFNILVEVDDRPGGTSGSVTVPNWTEHGGLVTGAEEMQRVRERVERAVVALGGSMNTLDLRASS